MRPTVYIETTILSYYCTDRVEVAAEIRRTREWWDEERGAYECFISAVVLEELSAGDYPGQSACLSLVEGLPLLEVVPDVMGELPEGLGVAKIEVSPSRVRVRGPESKIDKNDRVRTTPVDISTLTEPTEVEARLILPNPDVRLVTSRMTVIVRVLIQEINPEETTKIKK